MDYSKTMSTAYKRPKKPKRRFKANQSVDNATYTRTLNRLDALDKIPAGFEKKDKITGADARKVKRLLRRQRESKIRYTAGPYKSGQSTGRPKGPKRGSDNSTFRLY